MRSTCRLTSLGLLALLSFAAAPTATHASPPRPLAPVARPSRTHLALTERPRPLRAPSYFEQHAARVRYDLLLFHFDATDSAPPFVSASVADTDHAAGAALLVPAIPVEDPLRRARERDRLRLFRDPAVARPEHVAGWVGAFASASLLAAHAPAPLRVLFDQRIHFGPAVFDGGGVGVGVGGHMD